MSEVSDQQKFTRRRALGRKLAKSGSDLRIVMAVIAESADLQFLSDKESKLLDQRIKAVYKLAEDFDKLGQRLDRDDAPAA